MTNYDFYLKCKKEGITDSKSEVNIARIYVVAENNFISDDKDKILNMYEMGLEEFKQEKKQKRLDALQKKVDALKKDEDEQIAIAKKISELVGKEKPKYYYKIEYEKLTHELCELDDLKNSVYNYGLSSVKAGTIKEKDWATYGGIASGIAGEAAGVVTALNIQQQNAEIRTHNENLIKQNAQFQLSARSNIDNAKDELYKKREPIKTRLDNLSKRLVEFPSEIELLERLNPKIIEKMVTETKSIKISVRVEPVNQIIYGSVNAIADGSFKIFIIDQNDDIVDEAYFNLPKDGAVSQCIITGYSTKRIYKKKDLRSYRFVCIPANLCLIETKKRKFVEPKIDTSQFNKKESARLWKLDLLNQKENLPEKLEKQRNYELQNRSELSKEIERKIERLETLNVITDGLLVILDFVLLIAPIILDYMIFTSDAFSFGAKILSFIIFPLPMTICCIFLSNRLIKNKIDKKEAEEKQREEKLKQQEADRRKAKEKLNAEIDIIDKKINDAEIVIKSNID